MRKERLVSCAVLLAGGRGTRFWPRSRLRTPKQLLNITGSTTMLRATMERLLPVFGARNFWAVTNDEQAAAVRRELRGVPPSHVLAEPVGRNTAAAIGLAAIHLAHEHGDAIMAVLPSDSFIGKPAKYRDLVRAALHIAREPGHLVVLGIQPTRPETGYGYIEKAGPAARLSSARPYAVKRFTEKPALAAAEEYVASGNYFWNAGMFFWRASSFLENLKRFLPATHAALFELAATIGTRRYDAALRRIYPKLENISVDYAVMEPATRAQSETAAATRSASSAEAAPRVIVIPARVGWSDIGSWAAVYELLASAPGANVSAGPSFTLDASGNYLWSPKKFVAAVGVRDLVLVETADAILLCAREKSQDVAKIVKWLEQHKKKALL
ncbi:MAG TPA: sugar phosphate nucleotidyltransferase [Candidatus Limnocylindrales bacterium]|nr:sugar phosphate nucleotidyltransferase [Candidatus Limnocylindrales bacterium]